MSGLWPRIQWKGGNKKERKRAGGDGGGGGRGGVGGGDSERWLQKVTGTLFFPINIPPLSFVKRQFTGRRVRLLPGRKSGGQKKPMGEEKKKKKDPRLKKLELIPDALMSYCPFATG